MLVHVLLYQAGKDTEGIHSLELSGKTVVLMFENRDDAERYCLLLEAQDFPCPTVENIDRDEIENFCAQSGYESRFVEKGFIPKSDEDKLCLVPPERNRETSNWNDSQDTQSSDIAEDKLELIKKRLEGLL